MALKELSEKERFVIIKRRLSENPITLEKEGKHLHISKERARQIEAQAFRKMKLSLLRYVPQIKEVLSK